MKEALSDEVLRQVQEAVSAVTGVHIEREAAARLHAALREHGSSREVTVLLTDLRGFTAISEANPARIVVEVLNRFLARMCDIAVRNGGTIDKFMGDAVMVLFGAMQRGDDDARRAVTCAVQMQIAMEELNRENASHGLPPLYMGAGINTGRVMVGLLGSDLHAEHTVIGNEVNLASRIESFSLRGQVLISETTFARCGDFVSAGAPMDVHMKGKARPVRLREVLAIPSLALTVPRQEVRKSPRLEVRMPFSYQVLADKVVLLQRHSGVVLEIGYGGILAEVDSGLTPHSDILLELDLSFIGSRARDIGAKVRTTRLVQGRNQAGIEFTSVGQKADQDIRHFVQVLMQGSPTK